jgi:hypothetical protein
MRRESILASAIALSYAVLCGGPALAFGGGGIGGAAGSAGASGVGPSGVPGGGVGGGVGGGHVAVGGGGHVAGAHNFGHNVVEGRSVGVNRGFGNRLNGNAFWFGFYSPCFPYGYNYPYPYGPYGVCPPK